MENPQPFRKLRRVSDKNFSLSRKIRGYAVLAKGDMPIAVSEEEFLVPFQSSDKKYKVTNISGWNCECPDFRIVSLLKQSLNHPNTTKKELALK